jgi:predicted enzyme related to lactoylglutathione lyase
MKTTILSASRRVLAALALSLVAVPAFGEAAAPSPPKITGVLVRVVDLDKALDFYSQVAGFDALQMDRAKGHAELVSGEVKLWLLKVEKPIRHVLPGPSEAHLNLQIEKLDATLADLERRGVPRLADTPRTAAVGPNMPIADPSGNVLYVIQLKGFEGALPRARPFNFGITIPNMAEARKFYEGVLGFRVYSEKFYPPTIPYMPSGVLPLAIHENATGPAATPSPDTAQVNLVLQVDDLDAARRDLESRGGKLRSADNGVFAEQAELLDPFGNVLLLVERPSQTAVQEPQ